MRAPEASIQATRTIDMAKSQRLRLGVIGLGRRGQQHLKTINGLTDRYQLVAICDLSETVAAANAKRLGFKGYSDFNKFFSCEELDVVVITTPRETHHLVVKVAAGYGVHMLIETPLAPTRAMMDVIEEAVVKANVKVEVGENMWRRPTERLNRSAIDAGLIGKVLRVSSYYESAGGNSCYHTMSMMRLYADSDVAEVRAFAQRFDLSQVRPRTTSLGEETWTQAQLFYDNGVTGTCTYVTSWMGPLRRGHPRFMSIEGTEGFIVTGATGVNTLRRLENDVPLNYPKQIASRREGEREIPTRFFYETNPEVQFLNPFADRILEDVDIVGVSDGLARADELSCIYQAVTTGSAPHYGMAKARRDQELSILITESARLGRPLKAELRDGQETPWESEQHDLFRKIWGRGPFEDVDRPIQRP